MVKAHGPARVWGFDSLLRHKIECENWPILLPASTEISVNANQSHKLVHLGLSESQLGSKVIGFVGQYFQITGGPAFITHLRKPGSILRRECQLLLVLPKLLILVILDQRVRDAAKGLLDRLLISQPRFLLPRFSQLDAGADPSAGENGLCQRSSNTPQPSQTS